MTDLVSFLLARIDEDKAIEAARLGLPAGGERDCWDWTQLATKPNTSLIATASAPNGLRPLDVVRDDNVDRSVADYIARWDPARVLRECDAKRHIIAAAEDCPYGPGDPDYVDIGWRDFAAIALKLLALPYSSHPDYDESWRP